MVDAASRVCTVLITSGLKPGDKVVTEGQFRLKPGSKVQPLAPGEAGPATSAEELARIKDAAPKQAPQQRRRPGGGG
jgi:multidrug efflux system membrane fusion protein